MSYEISTNINNPFGMNFIFPTFNLNRCLLMKPNGKMRKRNFQWVRKIIFIFHRYSFPQLIQTHVPNRFNVDCTEAESLWAGNEIIGDENARIGGDSVPSNQGPGQQPVQGGRRNNRPQQPQNNRNNNGQSQRPASQNTRNQGNQRQKTSSKRNQSPSRKSQQKTPTPRKQPKTKSRPRQQSSRPSKTNSRPKQQSNRPSKRKQTPKAKSNGRRNQSTSRKINNNKGKINIELENYFPGYIDIFCYK